MRFAKGIFDNVASRRFIGNKSNNGRVTVDPYWSLKETAPIYAGSMRGPYRYYTDGDQVEYEVPSVVSIDWDRGSGDDLARCKVSIKNAWHEANWEDPELVGQLGKRGFFWPKRGDGDSSVTWNQDPGTGAYKRSGDWDDSFSWHNVLVEDVIIRTYEGWGGMPTKGNYVSIDDNLENGNSLITGIWLVQKVDASSNGTMTLDCVDIGKLLLDQFVFPPIVPHALYPLEYFPAGRSRFDSYWGPKMRSGVAYVDGQETSTAPGSRGSVALVGVLDSSADSDSSVSSLYPSEAAIDGDRDTYSLSDAFSEPDGVSTDRNTVWFEYDLSRGVDAISIKPWAGGYDCYISIYQDLNPSEPTGTSTWQGTDTIPAASPNNLPYVKKVNIPLAIPDGLESAVTIDLPERYYAQKVRITFQHLYYSHVADGSGNRYRAGIRDLNFFKIGAQVSPYIGAFEDLPWTFAMTQHPVRGYWIGDSSGTVYGFGDADDFDSDAFGMVPIQDYGISNRLVGLAAHPSGEGYWAVDWRGHVWAYGDAEHHGEFVVGDPSTAGKTLNQVRAIAATHTGEGYWVVYSNGVVRGFGDATPSEVVIPYTDVAEFMTTYLEDNYTEGKFVNYDTGLKATAIASHPKKMGFVVTDGSGQVWAYGGAEHKGQLIERVYNKGAADTFRLQPLEWATDIEMTADGEGYWIAFGSGRLAAFGNAVDQGPYDLSQYIRGLEDNIATNPAGIFNNDPVRFLQPNEVLDNGEPVGAAIADMDYTFFREIVWSVARDPDGTGFWVLRANGDVEHFNAEFWGQPGYIGLTGIRWHDGNFDGDWATIVKELLCWAGFLFYEDGEPSSPSVLGLIESTGIKTDTIVTPEKFDKRSILDVIKELAEVTGYMFRITEEGGAQFASPNWWRAGNFDENGTPIYVLYDEFGDYERVSSDTEGAEPFIPIIHEDINLMDYGASLSSVDKRSEFIIGNELPSAKDPTRTNYVRYVSPETNEQLFPGQQVTSSRGIQRPAMWVSQLFQNQEEMQIMAELIALHAFFAKRVGNTQTVGNPALSYGDQIRIVERTTSESYIHLIDSISSKNNLETGVYTMSIGSHWLGDADEWVIATDNDDTDGRQGPYVVISERLNSWQSYTGRGLTTGTSGFGSSVLRATGAFNSIVGTSQNKIDIGTYSKALGEIGIGDKTDALNFLMFGNGIKWPVGSDADSDGGTTLSTTATTATIQGMRKIMTVAYVPSRYADGDGIASASFDDYVSDVVSTWSDIRPGITIVGENMVGFDYDLEAYMELYDAIDSALAGTLLYGPNVHLAARDEGYDTSYNGVLVDSRDMGILLDFYAERSSSSFADLALSGDFSPAEWASLIEYIKDETDNGNLIVRLDGVSNSFNLSPLLAVLGRYDMILWPSDVDFTSPYSDGSSNWVFSGSIEITGQASGFKVRSDILPKDLGSPMITIYNQDDDVIYYDSLPEQSLSRFIGTLGEEGEVSRYTYRITGSAVARGNMKMRLTFDASASAASTVEGSIMILEAS